MRTIIETIDERTSFLKAHKGTDREKRHTFSAAVGSKKNLIRILSKHLVNVHFKPGNIP